MNSKRRKTAKKTAAPGRQRTARSPRNGAEIPLGAHPGNTGGKKGRSGRRPLALKRWASEVLYSKKVRAEIWDAATNRTSPNWVQLLRWLSDLSADMPPEELIVNQRDKRDRAMAMMLDALDAMEGRMRAIRRRDDQSGEER